MKQTHPRLRPMLSIEGGSAFAPNPQRLFRAGEAFGNGALRGRSCYVLISFAPVFNRDSGPGLVFGLAKGQPSDYVRRTQARTAPHFAGPAACLCLSGQKARFSTSNTKLRNPMPERNSKLARDARQITIRGAREHNLKNVDVAIPRDSLVVFTGLSGSGKSSLAFDTICAEGQRRYVESLSAYARQFLEMMQKPDVDQIDGLSPAIS